MNLYLISQTENDNYDTFDAAVVAAETEFQAKYIKPAKNGWNADDLSYWAAPEFVTVKYLGVAAEGTESGCILGSFNAG